MFYKNIFSIYFNISVIEQRTFLKSVLYIFLFYNLYQENTLVHISKTDYSMCLKYPEYTLHYNISRFMCIFFLLFLAIYFHLKESKKEAKIRS